MSLFCLFITELWPLINVRISFPLNSLRTNMHWYWQDLGLVCIFSKNCPWLSDFRFRSIFYNKWTDFNQFLYTFTDCYAFFFWKFAAELWPLIDVDWDFFMHTWSFNLHHEKRWGWAIVRFSDNSIFKLTFFLKKKNPASNSLDSDQ